MKMIAVNDDLFTEFSGEFSSKRGLMRVANRAVRQAYADRGLNPPSALRFDLFTGYDYTTARSYSPIEFDGDGVVFRHLFPDDGCWERDMTEVDVALFLAAHGPGMYRVARAADEPTGAYRRNTCRLNFWDGEDPAARAHALMGNCDDWPRIIAMQFISDRFGWCEGYSRVFPKSEIIERDGHTYSRRWWDAHHAVCLHCGQEFVSDYTRARYEHWNASMGTLDSGHLCDECTNSLHIVTEATARRSVVTDGLPDGYLTDFHGLTVLANNLDQCGICATCGEPTAHIYRRGLNDYCARHKPEDLLCYRHTLPGPGDFRSVGDADRDMGLFLGVELETVAPDDKDWASTAHDVAELATGSRGYVETKRDASLDSGGVEIVTMPATPLYHLTNDYWRDLLSYGRSKGVETPRCCGLHVHVNLDYFHDDWNDSEEQVTIDRFISRFTKQWEAFSGRESFYWCKLHSDGDMRIFPEDCTRRKRQITKDTFGRSHDTAVNHTFTNPTVEFRFFAGTMEISQLRASLECAAGLAIMARALNLSGELMETWDFDDVKNELCWGLQAHGIPCEDFKARCKAVGI